MLNPEPGAGPSVVGAPAEQGPAEGLQRSAVLRLHQQVDLWNGARDPYTWVFLSLSAGTTGEALAVLTGRCVWWEGRNGNSQLEPYFF